MSRSRGVARVVDVRAGDPGPAVRRRRTTRAGLGLVGGSRDGRILLSLSTELHEAPLPDHWHASPSTCQTTRCHRHGGKASVPGTYVDLRWLKRVTVATEAAGVSVGCGVVPASGSVRRWTGGSRRLRAAVRCTGASPDGDDSDVVAQPAVDGSDVLGCHSGRLERVVRRSENLATTWFLLEVEDPVAAQNAAMRPTHPNVPAGGSRAWLPRRAGDRPLRPRVGDLEALTASATSAPSDHASSRSA